MIKSIRKSEMPISNKRIFFKNGKQKKMIGRRRKIKVGLYQMCVVLLIMYVNRKHENCATLISLQQRMRRPGMVAHTCSTSCRRGRN
jgi:hypothetical protein